MKNFGNFLFFLIILIKFTINCDAYETKFIAHAGGAINGNVYTDSIKAVKNSINNNFKYIEIDLRKTSDNYLFGFHDWNSLLIKENIATHKLILNYKEKFEKKNLSKSDLIYLNLHLQYPLILETEIIDIFTNNNSIFLVTDKIQDFKLLETKFNSFRNRVYVEISSIKNYIFSLFYNIENRIFFTDLDFFDRLFINIFNIKNIVFDKKVVQNVEVVKTLIKYKKEKKGLFVYTINNQEELKNIQKILGLNLFVYTDFLKPNSN